MKNIVSYLFLFVSLFFVRAEVVAADQNYKYELAVCAIFQNEGPYLKEWIEYNLLIGVEKFYLLNNLSNDNYSEVLAPYIQKGIVDLYEWPHIDFRQGDSYDFISQTVKDDVKWMAYIDIDEYIVPMNVNTVPEFLKDYEPFAGVTINWVVFGTSNVERIPSDKLMIETLNMREMLSSKNQSLCKSIIRPSAVVKWTDPHMPTVKKGMKVVNSNKGKGQIGSKQMIDKIRINHYWLKDEWFFWNVKIPRVEKWGTKIDQLVKTYKRYSAVECHVIDKYIPEMRQRMGFVN
jgi:hypothetical protein